jgi:hypothetical protein
MKNYGRRYQLIFLTAAMLPGCAGSQSSVGAPSASLQNSALVQPVETGQSSIRARAKNGDLLYVSDPLSGVYIFSYPQGRLLGTLTGFQYGPEGLCSDRFGNVFVTDQASVIEFAHGGTEPIKTYVDTKLPIACAVDPSTGNLAVANHSGTGSISIYEQGSGYAQTYPVPFLAQFVTYDRNGNLYADGVGNPATPIAELRKEGDAFEKITYPGRNSGEPAGLQWRGNDLELGIASPYQEGCCGRIHHVAAPGSHGHLDGETLPRSAMANFFIKGSTLIVTTGQRRVAFYDFPQGGHAKRIIKVRYQAYGVVVSPAIGGPDHL